MKQLRGYCDYGGCRKFNGRYISSKSEPDVSYCYPAYRAGLSGRFTRRATDEEIESILPYYKLTSFTGSYMIGLNSTTSSRFAPNTIQPNTTIVNTYGHVLLYPSQCYVSKAIDNPKYIIVALPHHKSGSTDCFETWGYNEVYIADDEIEERKYVDGYDICVVKITGLVEQFYEGIYYTPGPYATEYDGKSSQVWADGNIIKVPLKLSSTPSFQSIVPPIKIENGYYGHEWSQNSLFKTKKGEWVTAILCKTKPKLSDLV